MTDQTDAATLTTPVDPQAFTEAVSSLETARRLEQHFTNQWNARLEALRTDCAPLLEARRNAEAAVEANDARVREMALAMYEQTGHKDLPHGVKVKIMTVLAYDTEAAIRWCKQHEPNAVISTLDRKMFEAGVDIGIITPDIEMIHLIKPTVTIPKEIKIG